MSFPKSAKGKKKSAESDPRGLAKNERSSQTEKGFKQSRIPSIYPSEKYRPQSPRAPATVTPDASRDTSNKPDEPVYSTLERVFPALNSLLLYRRKTYSGSGTAMPSYDPGILLNKHGDHDEHVFYKLESYQVRRCIERLCEEVNWDWFRKNLLIFKLAEGSDRKAFITQSWRDIRDLYEKYCEAKATKSDIMLKLDSSSFKGPVLYIGQHWVLSTVVLFTGWKNRNETRVDGRQVEILNAILSGGDFIKYIKEWCEKNKLKYPGGNSEFQQRVKLFKEDTKR